MNGKTWGIYLNAMHFVLASIIQQWKNKFNVQYLTDKILQCLLYMTSNATSFQSHISPLRKKCSFLCSTCLFRTGFNFRIKSASWIFCFNQFVDELVRISHENVSSMWFVRYLERAESWLGFSCWFRWASAFVSSTYDTGCTRKYASNFQCARTHVLIFRLSKISTWV